MLRVFGGFCLLNPESFKLLSQNPYISTTFCASKPTSKVSIIQLQSQMS